MIAADLFRGALLVPIAVLGLGGRPAALAGSWSRPSRSTAAASYFDPAYGALLPALVDGTTSSGRTGSSERRRDALSVGGWAARRRAARRACRSAPSSPSTRRRSSSPLRCSPGSETSRRAARTPRAPRIREGFAALRPLPVLAAASPCSASRSRSRRGRGWSASRRSSATRWARRRELLADGRGLRDRRRSTAGLVLTRVRPAQGAREHARLVLLPAGVRAVRASPGRSARARRRRPLRRRPGERVRTAHLGRAGGRPGPATSDA